MSLLSAAVDDALGEWEPLLKPDSEIPPTLRTAVWLEIAHGYWRRQSTDEAFRAFREALVLNAPHSLWHRFLDSDEWCRELLLAYLVDQDCRDRLAGGLFGNLAEKPEHRQRVNASDSHEISLTSRERDFLGLLPRGMTLSEMARREHVSINTVKTHLKGVYRKLGVSNRRSAVHIAQQLGLL